MPAPRERTTRRISARVQLRNMENEGERRAVYLKNPRTTCISQEVALEILAGSVARRDLSTEANVLTGAPASGGLSKEKTTFWLTRSLRFGETSRKFLAKLQ